MTAKTSDKPAKKPVEISEDKVRAFLKSHPEFLKNNLDLVGEVAPPERDLGDGIVDFQHYMLKNLQKDSKAMKSRYDMLVDFCRDNMSVQSQVHNAALKLIRTRNLEQLLEILTLDLVGVFDVDVVRIGMESETLFDTSYGEQNYSGIVFVEPGSIDEALGEKKNVLLIDDCAAPQSPGFDAMFSQLFVDCETLVASCALLRLELETIDKSVLLAFGVRHKERFHSGQGIELLHFLAQIIAHQLDLYLIDLTA